MNILIVEDNPISAKIVDMTLAKHGYRTLLAEDGEEAWQLLSEKQDIQMMIADINLPRLDGIALFERMHEHPWLSSLPIIVVSSENKAETVAKAADLGVVKYVVKPIKASQLLRDVRRILGHDRSVLASQRDIQMRMEIDRECYQEMIQAFSELVRETIEMLYQLPNQEDQRLPISEVIHLSESAELLGAERLHRFVDRLARLNRINTYHYFFLLHELHELEKLLPGTQGQSLSKPLDAELSDRGHKMRKRLIHTNGSAIESAEGLE